MEFDGQIKVYNLRTVFKNYKEKSKMGPHCHEISLECSKTLCLKKDPFCKFGNEGNLESMWNFGKMKK